MILTEVSAEDIKVLIVGPSIFCSMGKTAACGVHLQGLIVSLSDKFIRRGHQGQGWSLVRG